MPTPSKADLDAFRKLEAAACKSITPHPDGFNKKCVLPYGLKPSHVGSAMGEFVNFIGFVNQQLNTKGIQRMETMLMPANFSSMVGEFMSANIPNFCTTLAKNKYHNGHPDMVPKGHYKNDSAQHEEDGIEVKSSRYLKGWQGHNPEKVWLMVFVYESGRPTYETKNILPKPFRFLQVLCGQLEKSDWLYAGRSETSRRTITASVRPSGYAKMMGNWLYKAPDGAQPDLDED
jgi:hypothetical protein